MDGIESLGAVFKNFTATRNMVKQSMARVAFRNLKRKAAPWLTQLERRSVSDGMWNVGLQ
jgi:hypothetical protein